MRRRDRRPAKTGPSSSADWAALLAAAEACCRDAEGDGPADRDSEMRLMVFRQRLRSATTGFFQTEAGYPAYRTANGFLEIARAFADTRDANQRAALAPPVRATGTYLDAQLHASRQRAFEAAHRNRPEVNG